MVWIHQKHRISSIANNALDSIDKALATIENIQASLGAAQNRFTAIAQSQQDKSTDLSTAQSQITDADFTQETGESGQGASAAASRYLSASRKRTPSRSKC